MYVGAGPPNDTATVNDGLDRLRPEAVRRTFAPRKKGRSPKVPVTADYPRAHRTLQRFPSDVPRQEPGQCNNWFTHGLKSSPPSVLYT